MLMRVHRLNPPFDHGAALRVPPAHDDRSREKLWMWLGEAGAALDGGAVRVFTADGPAVAAPGDWIVLSVSGDYHVARWGRRLDG